ncbi:hypothetical protein JO972_13220 [Verrucomicrobiaceae bacterium 5K15]|uniref:Ice-binding protein C-terminal domain-containing protein n=1 Tax=Oceaniferula flava TaxID=2800421 RepID=A0AAE2VDB4_9BACT|nr:PEP-CTERM sorting domain-containing protein [Oceaniferula flavus]MBK1855926.1 hypothetical protein [Oceaniferula flavus]MBM1137233.1 hypothetical protein [Oceaniferula flavus]
MRWQKPLTIGFLSMAIMSGSSLAAQTVIDGVLTDDLTDLSYFTAPLNMSLELVASGVAMTSDVPSVDRLVDWKIDGTTRLNLSSFGSIQVTPEQQIVDGEWQLWVLYYTDTGSFLSEVNLQPFTTSTDTFSADLSSTAPVDADEFFLRFRIKEAVGDGFTFSEIQAAPVPEPSTALLGLASLALIFRRSRA